MKDTISLLLISFSLGVISSCITLAETPGEHFRKAIKEIEAACGKRRLEPNEVCGGVAKLRPADPLATEEGRFAQSIKIPNPVPEGSGYKSGMTPEQYFDHLCKTEAGEFIYETVENVEGLYQMRPRTIVTYESNHLFAPEDPYGGPEGSSKPELTFVGPRLYDYLESPNLREREPDWQVQRYHQSYRNAPTPTSKVARYSGYDGRDFKTMHKEYAEDRKSRFGYTWRGITRPHDRELGIAGSELLVLDLQTSEVLAVHRGFSTFEIDEHYGTAGFQWRKGCPHQTSQGGGARFMFLLKVLKPASSSRSEGGSNVAR